MFEDFRKQAEAADFPAELEEEASREELSPNVQNRFLGLTPLQRFILALLLMFMVILLGLLFLLVTEKIVFPGLG